MGRLDDIADRNRKAMRGDNLLVKAMGTSTTDKPAEPAARFTLPSQRKSGTAFGNVLILMVLLGTAIGIATCHNMEVAREDDERRLHEVK